MVHGIVRAWNPEEIVLLGDLLDCDAWSAHPRSTFAEGHVDFLRDEIAPANSLLDRLQGRGHRPLTLLEGNHEWRVERYLVRNAGKLGPTMFKVMNPEQLLRLRVDANGKPRRPRENMQWVPYVGRGVHSHHKITPNLVAVHGWSFAKAAAQVHLDAVQGYASIVFGHVHRQMSLTTRHPFTDELFQAWSPGCLCEFVPTYKANDPAGWAHGVTQVYVSERNPRDWTKYDVEIRGGRAILDSGREIRV